MSTPAPVPSLPTPNWEQFSEEVRGNSRKAIDAGATNDQAILSSLIRESFAAYQQNSIFRQWKRSIVWICIWPIAAISAYGMIASARFLIDVLQLPHGDSVLLALAGAVTLLAFASPFGTTSTQIDLYGKPIVTRLRLGRFEVTSDLRRLVWCLLIVGVLCGLQTGLLQFADIGFEKRYGVADSLLLTVDNILHGVLFDFCELYDIHFGPEWEHNVRTATVFLAFRVAFDVLVGVAVYLWHRNHELRQMLEDFPDDNRPTELARWIDDVLRDQRNWMAKYGAECAFLQMVRAFLENRFDDVVILDRILPAIKISASVRNMFRTSTGQPLFESPD